MARPASRGAACCAPSCPKTAGTRSAISSAAAVRKWLGITAASFPNQKALSWVSTAPLRGTGSFSTTSNALTPALATRGNVAPAPRETSPPLPRRSSGSGQGRAPGRAGPPALPPPQDPRPGGGEGHPPPSPPGDHGLPHFEPRRDVGREHEDPVRREKGLGEDDAPVGAVVERAFEPLTGGGVPGVALELDHEAAQTRHPLGPHRVALVGHGGGADLLALERLQHLAFVLQQP